MRRNILVRLKYLGDYSQYYYAKILQDFIKKYKNNSFYSWQKPKKSIQKMENYTEKKNYLELKTKYLLIILSRYALIEFNYGMIWFNDKTPIIKINKIGEHKPYEYQKSNDKTTGTLNQIKADNEQEIINYYNTKLYNDLNENLEKFTNEKYYSKIVLYINYINFVFSGFIFKHKLFFDAHYKEYKKHFENDGNVFGAYRIKIYNNCKNIVEQGNFKFKVYNLVNDLYGSTDIGNESDHFKHRMKRLKNNLLQNIKENLF